MNYVKQSLTTNSADSPGHRYAFADGLRGLAAAWVVLFHLSEGKHISNLASTLPNWVQLWVFHAGHLGVAVFFVLSGFVMMLGILQKPTDGISAERFVRRRLVRLAPPYYFAVAIAAAAVFVKSLSEPSTRAIPDTWTVGAHLLFIQGLVGVTPLSEVFWTLCIEIQFYIVFALMFWALDAIARPKGTYHVRSIGLTIAGLFALAWPLELTGHLYTLFLEFWFSFLAGCIVCHARRDAPWFYWYAWVYGIALVAVGLLQNSPFVATAGVVAMALLAANSLYLMNRWLNWSWLQGLAAISYSLYLLHSVTTGTSFRILNRFIGNTVGEQFIKMSIVLGLCVVVSAAAYYLIERPSIRWSRRIGSSVFPRPREPVTTAP